MEIWLLRHADAEEKPSGARDADRRLSPAGRAQMERVAAAIRSLAPDFDGLLTSPFVRARETLDSVAAALGRQDLVCETETLKPDADPRAVLSEIDAGRFERVLLVGHMPHLGTLLGLLLTGREDLELEMRGAGLACVESDSASSLPATLRFFLPPRLLEKIGETDGD